MASVRSLGLHHPSGLQRAIDEEILPPNPSSSSYRWETFYEESTDGTKIEDELLTTETCVIWSRGGVYQTTYNFSAEKETIVQALFADFPAFKEVKSHSAKNDSLQRALVVILKTQAHVYALQGSSHTVHLPFEVESACTAPVGVILQRKPCSENLAPLALKFPRVHPESFVSSQLTNFASSQRTNFSVETLGNPKAMNLNLSTTIENTWDHPTEEETSLWPRLVCLTDPLKEIGLVVTDAESQGQNLQVPVSSGDSKKSKFLDPNEEILHIEEVELPECTDRVLLAVTSNRQTNNYTIWRLNYLEPKDPFIGQHKMSKSRAARRRSSMVSAALAVVPTPTKSHQRDSFGAPLPGKRPRKSEKHEKSGKASKPTVDLVSTLEQQTNDSTVARRSSRRVSSMLARADLSASHDRTSFTEQQLTSAFGSGAKRNESHGARPGRMSSSQTNQIRPSLGSLLEAPFDIGLDESFHNMGLNDHVLEGLQHEMHFYRLHSFPSSSNDVRYSFAHKTSSLRPKVFIVKAPPFATNERCRGQLLIGIQTATEKLLQFSTLYIKAQTSFEMQVRAGRAEPAQQTTVTIIPGELHTARNVLDSCRLEDSGQSSILVLSEMPNGQHELTTQAPWSELTKVSLSLLFADDERNLQFKGRTIERDVRSRKSEMIASSDSNIIGLRHPASHGSVDLVDATGRLHRVRIQLQPKSSQVRKALQVCRGTLAHALGERVHAGWLHVTQWLQTQEVDTRDLEWSAFVIVLFAMALNLGRTDSKSAPVTKVPVRGRRPASGSFSSIQEAEDWRALQKGEAANALGYIPWMLNSGWNWAVEDSIDDATLAGDQLQQPKFIARHISLAREFMASPAGELALGVSGFLPTHLGRDWEARAKAFSDIIIGLHLLSEEQKLDIMTPEFVSPGRADLRAILLQVVKWLRWPDFASLYEVGLQEEADPRNDSELVLKTPLAQPSQQPDILSWIQARLILGRREHYTTCLDIYYSSAGLMDSDKIHDDRWNELFPRTMMFKQFFRLLKVSSTAVEVVEALWTTGVTAHILESLPEAVAVPLRDAISLCQPHPPTTWAPELLHLVSRDDINSLLIGSHHSAISKRNILAPTHAAAWDFKLLCQYVKETNTMGYEESQGIERQGVIQALFKDDRRLNEAMDLLSTHKARAVRLPQSSLSEREYLEKQKEVANRVALGTLATPAGRGLLFYGLRFPLITQQFHIGGFNLNCMIKPGNVTVGVDKSLFTEEKVCWGFFHQGVASGLGISPHAKGIDHSWILFNKPAEKQGRPPGEELSNRHAGFLLALGLNGHLKGVAKWVAFRYLTPKHTMTSIGLLLGLAVSYMGTMDSLITRLLSVHATRMLPRGAAELNLNPMTQTSGIMGIGLLYANSQHRRMSEIMLSEIEHIEEEDEEEPLRSESYRLAAGFSLGFINLGKGNDLKGLHDMKVTEKLVAHSTATKNVDVVHVLDRAAAGAVMAIALIFMKTEDAIVARKIDVPDSVLQFDHVRPDILLLRTVTKNLIMWSQITPSTAWLQKSLPMAYRPRCKLTGIAKLKSTDLPFFSILAGLCFSIGLKFSGSASLQVRDLLLYYLDHFMRIVRIPSTSTMANGARPYDEELARTNARMCQDVLALSASIVMAGTGDIPVLRRLRALHGRDDPDTPYGSHLAAHLAIGSLFLGCGTVTFGTSNQAIAALLLSFYPILPTNVTDNRAHLQAFRHFWILATEQRCLVAKDVTNGQVVNINVQVSMRDGTSSEPVQHRTTPCLLPPLDQILSVSTKAGPQFWDIDIDMSNARVREAFAKDQSIWLQRRPPRDRAFAATLGALGAEGKNDPNPMGWVFGLESLKGVSCAERTAILEDGEQDEDTGRAVDARLEMGRGIMASDDKERLEGARLLFEWESARDRLLRRTGEGDGTEGAAVDAAEEVWWMRDSAIEALKGKVWLAGQEAEL